MLAYTIPDEPEWVEDAINAVEHQSKQAWRQQVIECVILKHISQHAV